MTQELLYTSAPRGLKPGAKGFCTVASTAGMPPTLADRLESLSGYRHLFPPHDKQAQLNPVQFSHLIVKLGGQVLHVLSRVCDAGLDYSQRSNKLAHHVVLTEGELSPGGPAWLLAAPGFMETAFAGEPRILPAGREPPAGKSAPRICRSWEAITGDAGWAGVLAESAADASPKVVNVIYPVGTDVLPLVEEAMALLPARRRWAVTFSTYYTKLPPGVDCHWRFLVDGDAEAKAARRTPQIVLIDLATQLGPAEGGALVSAARTGQVPEPAVAEAAAGDIGSGRSWQPAMLSSPAGGRAPTGAASFTSRREAAAPAGAQIPPELWPSVNTSIDFPQRRSKGKRILLASLKAAAVLSLAAGALVLGEFHGRQDAGISTRAELADANAKAGALQEELENKKQETDKLGKERDDARVRCDTEIAAAKKLRTQLDDAQAQLADQTKRADALLKERDELKRVVNGKEPGNTYGGGPVEGSGQPPGKPAAARFAELAEQWGNKPIELSLPGLDPSPVPLNIRLWSGVQLALDCGDKNKFDTAKWWDPDLQSVELQPKSGGPQTKWVVQRKHKAVSSGAPHELGEFSMNGDTVAFKWAAESYRYTNLLDCWLVVQYENDSRRFRLRKSRVVEPHDIELKLGDTAKNKHVLLGGDEAAGNSDIETRPWPLGCRYTIFARSPIGGFKLLPIGTAPAQRNGIVLAPGAIDPIEAAYGGDACLSVRFVPLIVARQTGGFHVVFDRQVRLRNITDDWVQLNKTTDLKPAASLAKDVGASLDEYIDPPAEPRTNDKDTYTTWKNRDDKIRKDLDPKTFLARAIAERILELRAGDQNKPEWKERHEELRDLLPKTASFLDQLAAANALLLLKFSVDTSE